MCEKIIQGILYEGVSNSFISNNLEVRDYHIWVCPDLRSYRVYLLGFFLIYNLYVQIPDGIISKIRSIFNHASKF